MFLSKGKHKLIKVHVPVGDDTVRHGVIAAITLSVGRVTKEDTWNGTRSEFMRCGGGGVGVATATENTETIVGGRSAI